MLKVLLISLAFASVFADFGMNYVFSELDYSTATCLSSNNISRLIMPILDSEGNAYSTYLQSYINARGANFTQIDASFEVNDQLEPYGICNNITGALPRGFKGIIWARIDSQSQWSVNSTSSDRISYLEDVATNCSQHGVKIGIYSSAPLWAQALGNAGASSDILSALPVWYSNMNGQASFDDFDYAGFGNWTEPDMKEYAQNYLCNFYSNYQFY